MDVKEISHIIDVAIAEDIRSGDITTEACVTTDDTIEAKLVLKQRACLAGLHLLPILFQRVHPKNQVEIFCEEGEVYRAGTLIATVKGPAVGIFSSERIALNLLQHASGIATITHAFVNKIRGTKCEILDTRKTLPGLRYLEKYAVTVGGGINHRYALDDRFIITSHHLSFLSKNSSTPLKDAIMRCRSYRCHVKVEVEVETLHQIEDALDAKADIIRLYNMTVPMVKHAVKMIDGRAYVELAGGVTMDTVRAYAETGIDGIAVSALTDSVQAIDIVLRF